MSIEEKCRKALHQVWGVCNEHGDIYTEECLLLEYVINDYFKQQKKLKDFNKKRLDSLEKQLQRIEEKIDLKNSRPFKIKDGVTLTLMKK